MSAPFRTPLEKIRSFAISKFDWIRKHLAKLQTTTHEKPLKYVDDETIHLRGIPYLLKVTEHNAPPKTQLREGMLELFVRPDSSAEKKAQAIAKRYHQELSEAIPPLISKWEPIIGVKVADFGIKKMRTRWGTCMIGKRKIWLSLELAKKSPEHLEYVVVHEMVHLLEASHNKRFQGFMTQFLPHWKTLKLGLNGRIDG